MTGFSFPPAVAAPRPFRGMRSSPRGSSERDAGLGAWRPFRIIPGVHRPPRRLPPSGRQAAGGLGRWNPVGVSVLSGAAAPPPPHGCRAAVRPDACAPARPASPPRQPFARQPRGRPPPSRGRSRARPRVLVLGHPAEAWVLAHEEPHAGVQRRAMPPEPLLAVEGLRKSFPARRGGKPPVRAVADVSSTMARGEVLSVVGGAARASRPSAPCCCDC